MSLTFAQRAYLERWAVSIAVTDDQLFVDGVDCTRIDRHLGPEKYNSACRTLVERVRRSPTRRFVVVYGAFG